MTFGEIKEEEFRKFLDGHQLKTFVQTPEMAKIRKEFGYNYYYVGVKDKSCLVAASMIGSRKNRFGMYEFYAPRGLLVDYENYDVLSFFTKELKKFVKNKKGYILRIDPYYITKEKDIDGNDVVNGINHELGIMNLIKCGYKKSKHIYQQFKYMFSLDLKDSKDDIFNQFHSLPKRMIKKAEENGIVIREATYDEIPEVEKLINETSERKNFRARNLDYYKLLYKNFHKKNQVKFMIGELDIKKYQKIRRLNIKKLQTELLDLKKQSKIDECNKKIEKEEKLIEDSKLFKVNENNKLILSACVFILYGDELIYLFGGNRKEYMHYGASYLMQWTMIQYAIDNGFNKYNFYGISAVSKNDGVYSFKRGFNGYVEELIGDYEVPVSWYYYFEKLLRIIK